jgi:threonine aldolase
LPCRIAYRGKRDAGQLADVIGAAAAGNVHHVQPAAISLTQATEAGTVYTVDEVTAIAEVARRRGLALQMDGARFANAAVALDRSPAELTWKAGVDVLSFGATKNGAMAAEAVVFFDPARAEGFGFRRKRGGHLFSKMRFLSAQLEAYLADDLWLRNARHANAMAARLATGLDGLPGLSFRHPVEANELFVEVPGAVAAGLEAEGFLIYRWQDGPDPLLRLVTAFSTTIADVDRFIATAARHAGASP